MAGRSHGVCGRMSFRQPGQLGGHHGRHPPTGGLLASDRKSRNQSFLRALDFTAVVKYSVFPCRGERKLGSALGMSKMC